ncbi:TPA: hypothetical protein N0F65_000938 [Lagenidium giganteum]|uniref:Cytidyltransferase-like domain-containing protein n=1 Tax=Lagenidium giganteum TaxID=4803 RepID=A0AAV2YMT1_9STRA|nr:TPA: hypothetical protein N0F65_000938 [Lagenidium giganteum]
MAKRVLIYGMSANPPTGLQGHMGAVAFLKARFDEIWLMPVYQHIYSTKRHLAPFHHRVAMCRRAVEVLPAQGAIVDVKETEKDVFEQLAAAHPDTDASQLRVGTIDLIRFLHQRHPDTSFSMLLGADTYADLRMGKWKNGEELQQLLRFVVMTRKGYEPEDRELAAMLANAATSQDPAADDANARVLFVSIPSMSDLASTTVRNISDEHELRQLVAPSVAEYIIANKLYAFADK